MVGERLDPGVHLLRGVDSVHAWNTSGLRRGIVVLRPRRAPPRWTCLPVPCHEGHERRVRIGVDRVRPMAFPRTARRCTRFFVLVDATAASAPSRVLSNRSESTSGLKVDLKSWSTHLAFGTAAFRGARQRAPSESADQSAPPMVDPATKNDAATTARDRHPLRPGPQDLLRTHHAPSNTSPARR